MFRIGRENVQLKIKTVKSIRNLLQINNIIYKYILFIIYKYS